MVEVQIIGVKKRRRSKSIGTSIRLTKRPSAFFILRNLLLRVLKFSSPILIGRDKIANGRGVVKHILPILRRFSKLTSLRQGLAMRC